MAKLEALFDSGPYYREPDPVVPLARIEIENAVTAFRGEMERVAASIARHDGDEVVTPGHVRRARDALLRSPGSSHERGSPSAAFLAEADCPAP